jgi:stearoyl-CoA desaturase (delta-9 desaturase)
LLVAGFLRLALQFHATFAINSVAHLFGSRPYSLGETARDNLVTAMLTLGEGYHNYHHRFPFDYRCGRRWYDFDPTKWWLQGLAALGLVRKRKAAPIKIIDEACRKVQRMRSAEGAGMPR